MRAGCDAEEAICDGNSIPLSAYLPTEGKPADRQIIIGSRLVKRRMPSRSDESPSNKQTATYRTVTKNAQKTVVFHQTPPRFKRRQPASVRDGVAPIFANEGEAALKPTVNFVKRRESSTPAGRPAPL
jgi:hypothetical protein